MKEKPEVDVDYNFENDKVRLIISVPLESSAKNIDLDVNQFQVKLSSANYDLSYTLSKGNRVDPDSVACKFSKK